MNKVNYISSGRDQYFGRDSYRNHSILLQMAEDKWLGVRINWYGKNATVVGMVSLGPGLTIHPVILCDGDDETPRVLETWSADEYFRNRVLDEPARKVV